ncbi:hypothetical protein [Selenomonas ruminis]|uniref:Uncharacterized protein n=1 Tax=Selenomonas ruminis TaxID=2593411 RepID=A0A5D6VW17_9FIRM|nr:hypothetical protein [Selenomonas sp. mPRGC5]TYZ19617.1 hypothetical protein FZ040_13110 [Selenomonas sp. mPRGC5]
MRKSEKDFERKPKSRLERIAEEASSNERKTGVASIAGNRVTQTEAQRKKKITTATVSTNFRLPRDVKEQCAALASLKQVTLTELVVHAMKMQLKRNAPLINQFTKFNIDPNSIKEDL